MLIRHAIRQCGFIPCRGHILRGPASQVVDSEGNSTPKTPQDE